MKSSLSRWVLFRVYIRSLFLQAGFNPVGLQNLGLLYALFPALEVLYPDQENRTEATRRHLTPFNTHPYAAAAIVGGILFHEERIARGEAEPERVAEFKRALMGPLAALGDGFFWLSLRPFAGAVAVATTPWLHAGAAIVYLCVYNSVHLWARARLFSLGLNYGDALVQRLVAFNVPAWTHRLRDMSAALVGAATAYLAFDFGHADHGVRALILAVACLLFGAFAFEFVRRGKNPYILLYTFALIAGGLGAFL